MTDEALLYRPCLEDISYEGENKYPGVVAAGKLSKDLNYLGDVSRLVLEIPLTDILYIKEFEDYCADLFNMKNEKKLLQ